jgi:hypothetical protein
MKKLFAITMIGCLLGGWLLLARSQRQPQTPVDIQRKTSQAEPSNEDPINQENFSETESGDVIDAKAEPRPATEIVTHATRADFSIGQFDHTIARRTLHLDGAGKAAGSPLITGSYTSGEEMSHRSFDRITFNYRATVPVGSSLKFEAHTVSPDGQWSNWREIFPKDLIRPIEVEASAAGWQYRFTLFASSVARSPEVESVVVVTERKNAAATFGSSNTAIQIAQKISLNSNTKPRKEHHP